MILLSLPPQHEPRDGVFGSCRQKPAQVNRKHRGGSEGKVTQGQAKQLILKFTKDKRCAEALRLYTEAVVNATSLNQKFHADYGYSNVFDVVREKSDQIIIIKMPLTLRRILGKK